MKRIVIVLALLAPRALVFAGGKKEDVPSSVSSDPVGYATIKPGQTIKIGMGAPMTGDNAAFGIDISNAAKIAVKDAGTFNGFTFELVAQDDPGRHESGDTV